MALKEREPHQPINSLETSAGEPIITKVHVLKLLETPGEEDRVGKQRKRYQRECCYCLHNLPKCPVINKTSYHCEGPSGNSIHFVTPKLDKNVSNYIIRNGLASKRHYSHE